MAQTITDPAAVRETTVAPVTPSPSTFWVPVKPCCGEVLMGEQCDCAALLAEMETAPVIFWRWPAASRDGA